LLIRPRPTHGCRADDDDGGDDDEITCLAAPNFSILSHKGHDFQGGEKVIEHKMRVLILSTTFT
jgi:hypothetical protein